MLLPPTLTADPPPGRFRQADHCEEALELCTALSQALAAEQGRRSTILATYGQPGGDARRISRLERLWRRAADRWRRRAGYAPVYAD